jgi:hypothetical protein
MLFLRLYADCFRRAGRGVRKSPWTLALPMVYLAIAVLAAVLVVPLGPLGGFVLTLVADLCMSSYLYFVAQAVQGSPSRPRELKQSFLAYFWPVVSFGFVVWISSAIMGYALAAHPRGGTIKLAIWVCAGVLLNAVPEVIYQKSQVGGLAIISESVRFIQNHWIEWFIPNLVLFAAFYGVVSGLGRVPYGVLLLPPVLGALTYFTATFRGNLFHLIETTSPYQLRLRYGRSA